VGLLYGSLLFANTMKMLGTMDEKLKNHLIFRLCSILGLLGYGMYSWIRGKLESRLNERLEKEQQEMKNRQNLHIARVYRNMGHNFWQLFGVEKIREKNNSTSDSSTKKYPIG
jgi:hypothetical protein